MIGVVPRARYLELLEKHDALRCELKKAQEAIRKLHETLGHKGEPYAKNVVDVWNAMLDETLEAQAEWIRVWKGQARGMQNSLAKPTTKARARIDHDCVSCGYV